MEFDILLYLIIKIFIFADSPRNNIQFPIIKFEIIIDAIYLIRDFIFEIFRTFYTFVRFTFKMGFFFLNLFFYCFVIIIFYYIYNYYPNK